ncbi:discoidin domain-containing protein [Bacteroides pyogenes]|uniref:F5/8 type C domain-containing protein n=2 Tax=Bacteroides pyogenes TaxID=310300 RepID=W4PGJ3_9BACE|nr:discoidin domain-containing protein [Bacteroides pyogenes]GAE15708.1 hypothetical protein JCM6292_2025 [Bacteroides pyogenes JCM 6292]MCF2709975.1 discoidin domain-containing protein [Bacteroides pyogenes]MCI7070182.1 discoidin domain-containing protein [Bacteroides pyogenes]MDY4249999.1 discoidin domain-containing protein [Bacteroides pyogenes]MDY5433213.1 discoidin domain-containing protein [Bacteroides pyogenes]
MKIKNIFYLLISGLIFLSSCEKDPVVLEFDENYSPKKPTPGKRDPLPPVDLLTVYAYFHNNVEQQIVVRTIKPEEEDPVIEDMQDKEIILKTSIPVEVVTKFDVVTMTAENAENLYPKVIKGATLALPADAYSLEGNSVTLEKGEKQATITLKFKKEKFLTLDKTKEYALPLIMQLKEGEAKIVNYYVLNISIEDVEGIPEGNNVELAQVSGKTLSGNSLVLDTDFSKGHLYKLNDENIYTNWWVDTNISTIWLKVNLKETAKVKGFTLATRTSNQKLKSVKVWASQDGGTTYVEQGVVTGAESYYTVPVSFKKPIQVNSLKLTDFTGIARYIDLHEIELIVE